MIRVKNTPVITVSNYATMLGLRNLGPGQPIFLNGGSNPDDGAGGWYQHSSASLGATSVALTFGGFVTPVGPRWSDTTGTALVRPDGEVMQIPVLLTGNPSGGFILASAQNADAVVNGETNTILITTANTANPSYIGRDDGPPRGGPGTNSDPLAAIDAIREQPWAADTSYPEGGVGGAGVAVVFGGYDHICNQLAGLIFGGGHHYMPYNINGHSTIIGGSNHRVSGGRCTIVGGVDNTVAGASNLGGAIYSGRENVVYGASIYSTIIGGQENEISAGVNSTIIAGLDNKITSATGAVVLNGRENEALHTYSAVSGYGARSLGAGLWMGAVLTAIGDSQSVMMALNRRTTNATLANMVDSAGGGIQFEAGRRSVFSGRVSVSALDEATGDIAAYETTFAVRWDGTTATVWAGGSSGATRPLTSIVDQIAVAAVPIISASTGLLRVQVTGKLTTNIKWAGHIAGAMSAAVV